jgi:hypothetical protein
VAAYPERLQYIYFDTVLLLRAVARIAPYLSSYDYCASSDTADDANTLQTLNKVTEIAKRAGKFDETVLFRGENANVSRCSLVLRNLGWNWTIDPTGRVQNTLPKCVTDHGLRWVRQVPALG